MRRHFIVPWGLTRRAFIHFLDSDSFSYAGSISFSTIFSLPAILIVALSIASTFYERGVVQTELLKQVGELIGKESTLEIEKIILNASTDSSGVLARIFGVLTLLFSATAVFSSLQSSLNNMMGIRAKRQKSWVKYLLNRLVSFALVISIGFVLLVSLLIDVVLVVFQNILIRYMDGLTTYLIAAINLGVSIAIITSMFALMFKVLPDARIRWRDVWVGALITTVLFTAGKYLIGLYLGSTTISSAYGAAGSLVIILIWVYYSTLIFLFGGQFVAEVATAGGRHIRPYGHAIRVEFIEVTTKDEAKPSK